LGIRYNQGGEIIEIIIRDNTGAKIENYKFKVNDKRAKSILKSIQHKYGMDKDDKDLDWLKKSSW